MLFFDAMPLLLACLKVISIVPCRFTARAPGARPTPALLLRLDAVSLPHEGSKVSNQSPLRLVPSSCDVYLPPDTHEEGVYAWWGLAYEHLPWPVTLLELETCKV
jgi:hypothetical protein